MVVVLQHNDRYVTMRILRGLHEERRVCRQDLDVFRSLKDQSRAGNARNERHRIDSERASQPFVLRARLLARCDRSELRLDLRLRCRATWPGFVAKQLLL